MQSAAKTAAVPFVEEPVADLLLLICTSPKGSLLVAENILSATEIYGQLSGRKVSPHKFTQRIQASRNAYGSEMAPLTQFATAREAAMMRMAAKDFVWQGEDCSTFASFVLSAHVFATYLVDALLLHLDVATTTTPVPGPTPHSASRLIGGSNVPWNFVRAALAGQMFETKTFSLLATFLKSEASQKYAMTDDYGSLLQLLVSSFFGAEGAEINATEIEMLQELCRHSPPESTAGEVVYFFGMAQKKFAPFDFAMPSIKLSQFAKSHQAIALTMQKNFKELSCDPSCMATMSEDLWRSLEGERMRLQIYIAAGRRGTLDSASGPSTFLLRWRLTYVSFICNLASAQPFPADGTMYTRFGMALDTCANALTAAQLAVVPDDTIEAGRRVRLYVKCLTLVELAGAFDRVLRHRGNLLRQLTGSALTAKASRLFAIVRRQVARDVDNP